MESHADKIATSFYQGEQSYSDGFSTVTRLLDYAKALEFALECIGKGLRMPTDVPLGPIPKPQPMADDVRRPGDTLEVVETGKEPVYTEAKRLDTEHFFKDYNENNPCGKPLCSVCCPKEKL